MKRVVTLFALIAVLGLVFTGCKKKPADKAKDTKEMAPAAMDEMKPDMDEMRPAAMDEMRPAAMDAMAGGDAKIGIAECDAYFKAMKCYISKLPAAAQAATKAGFDKSIAMFKKMAAGPAKANVAKSCKMAMDAWKKGIAKQPKFADCLK